MKYVIDPTTKFTGCVVTSMTDDVHCDYYGRTIEELRKEHNNPHLTAISIDEVKALVSNYQKELHNGEVVEITEEEYYWLYECLPPARNLRNMFFVGESYYGDIFPFCFKSDGRYFKCYKLLNTPIQKLQDEIKEFISSLKTK